MKKIGLLLVPMALALSACQNGEKQAGQLFQRAEAAYAAGEYSLAKLQIDSIRTLYPKAFEVRKAGIKLMQQIDRFPSERGPCRSLWRKGFSR